MKTYTDPATTETDLAAVVACREATWPTAAEMDPAGANAPEVGEPRPKARDRQREMLNLGG